VTAQRVFVTGGAGFIGSTVCRALVASGLQVRVFDNLSFGRRELLGPPTPSLELIVADLRDDQAITKAIADFKPDQVLHLGALHFIPYCNAHPVEAVEVNINGTRNLLSACQKVRPRLVLFASTAAVYPLEGSPFQETRRADPVDIYGHTKLVGEDLCRLFFLETKVATIVARFFNAFGPNDTNPHLVPDIVEQLRAGRRKLSLGNLDPVRDYIHVEDMTAGVRALIGSFPGGFDVFNVGSASGHSVRDVVEAFGAALGETLEVAQDPERVRKVERAQLVADTSKLRSVSGWSPKWDLVSGVRQLVAASIPRA
jgi:UDP-glucose 4-epimerase